MSDINQEAGGTSPKFAAFRGRGLGHSAGTDSHSQLSNGTGNVTESSSLGSERTSRWEGGRGRFSGRGGGGGAPSDNGDSSARPQFGGRGGARSNFQQDNDNSTSPGDNSMSQASGRFSDRGGRFSDRGGQGGRFSDGGRGGGSSDSAGGSRFSERSDRGGRFADRGERNGGFSNRGGRGGRFADRGDGDSEEASSRGGGFSNRRGGFSDRGDGDGSSSRGGRRGRGGRFGGDGRDNSDRTQTDGDDMRPRGTLDESRPPPYVPPPAPEGDDLFKQASTGINFNKYDDIPVRLTGREPVSPVSSFDEANLNATIAENVRKSGYKKPTPVQKYAMPCILSGRDLMACAQTGSGKTASFLLPVMSRMMADGIDASVFAEVQTPAAIIVAPTRELVNQIWLEALKFSSTTMMRPVVLYGGTSLGRQLKEVENGCHLVIATPGRLMDVINRRKIDLGSVKYLILDEADRMLDMGFLPSIQKLVEQLGMSASRQTMMFSATFATEVQELAKNFLDDYLFLTVGVLGGASHDVDQNVVQVEEFDKRKQLIGILSSQGSDRTIVFVETKRTADFLASYLCQQQFPCTSIHGDRLQQEREEALSDFKRGDKPVLVATSVASRGLDIQDVKHIINFDLPSDIDDYVHRIGRTGRIGHSGLATSFFTIGKDESIARSLVKILSESSQEVPEWLETAATQAIGSDVHSGTGGFGGHDVREGGRRGRGRGGGYNGSERQEEGSSKPWSVAKSSGAGAAQEEENWD